MAWGCHGSQHGHERSPMRALELAPGPTWCVVRCPAFLAFRSRPSSSSCRLSMEPRSRAMSVCGWKLKQSVSVALHDDIGRKLNAGGVAETVT